MTTHESWHGPVAIVTGGGSGIGRATALRLAEAGHALVLVGRRTEPLEAAAGAARQRGVPAWAVPADVAQAAAPGRVVAEAMERLGRVDVLVNGAGCAPRLSLAEANDDVWRAIIDTNVSSAFRLTREVWPIMAEQYRSRRAAGETAARGGTVVNLSSAAARDPLPGLGLYGIAKAGVNMLTFVTAREGQDVGIRALCVAPYAVETAMFRTIATVEQVASEDILRPDEVAEVIASFVSGTLAAASGETLYLRRKI